MRFAGRMLGISALGLIACTGYCQPAAPALPEGVDLSRPLTLGDCVRIALAVNPQLLVAQNGVRQATASVTQARSAQLPSLSFEGSTSATRRRGSTGTGGGTLGGGASSSSWGTDLVLNQTLYQSGLAETIRSAKASARASQLGLEDSRRTVALNVVQSYLSALAARELLDVAGRTVENAARHLEAARARIEAGTAAQSDLYPFEVEMAQARLGAITAENQAQTALTALKEAIGLPAETTLQLADELGRPPLEETLPDLLQTAYRERPDLRRQLALIEAARLTSRVAEIERGPVVDVSGSATYGTGSTATGTAAQIQAGVTFPIFDGGFTKARVESARAALDSAQQTLQQLQIAVGAEVERSYLNAVEANNRIDAAEAALRSAQVSLAVAEQRYSAEVGIGTVIDVTDAQIDLRQAEVDRIQAYYDYNNALAALRAAVGRPIVEGVE